MIPVAAATFGLTTETPVCGIITHHHISEQALSRIKEDGYGGQGLDRRLSGPVIQLVDGTEHWAYFQFS